MITIAVTGMGSLQKDMLRAVTRAPAETTAVVAKGALNIKNDWRRRWSGHPHIKAIPRFINYDIWPGPFATSAEIGPVKNSPQGPLAALIEYGSVNNPPIPGGAPALDAEAPKFEAAIAALAERLLAAQ